MIQLAMLILAAVAGGDENGAPAPAAAAKRRALPLSAREAVSLSLNHNLDIEVARLVSQRSFEEVVSCSSISLCLHASRECV